LFLRIAGAEDEAAHETACRLLFQLLYKPVHECCRCAFYDALKDRRETPAQCQRLVRILLALTDLKWKETLHSTKM
jgi:hypothetical protein